MRAGRFVGLAAKRMVSPESGHNVLTARMGLPIMPMRGLSHLHLARMNRHSFMQLHDRGIPSLRPNAPKDQGVGNNKNPFWSKLLAGSLLGGALGLGLWGISDKDRISAYKKGVDKQNLQNSWSEEEKLVNLAAKMILQEILPKDAGAEKRQSKYEILIKEGLIKLYPEENERPGFYSFCYDVRESMFASFRVLEMLRINTILDECRSIYDEKSFNDRILKNYISSLQKNEDEWVGAQMQQINTNMNEDDKAAFRMLLRLEFAFNYIALHHNKNANLDELLENMKMFPSSIVSAVKNPDENYTGIMDRFVDPKYMEGNRKRYGQNLETIESAIFILENLRAIDAPQEGVSV